MESARVCRRDSWIFFRRRTQMFSVFRKRRCRKDSLPLRRRAIISIGIMQRRNNFIQFFYFSLLFNWQLKQKTQ